ncbi:MAG: phasin family protein [Rhodocyclaceae bacterium]|nr:phasin family protein [Rhodocyclaceae bacterium]
MSFPAEKLLAVHQANVTLAFNIANTFMSGTEQLLALNLRTARSALESSLETSRSVMSGKTPTDLLDLPSSLGHPVLETTLGYLRSIYDIQLQTAEELAALTETQRDAFNKNLFSALDSVAESGPAGSDVAISAVKSAFAAANSAYDNLSKATRQAADLAEANVEAATRATAKPARPAASASKNRKAA